MTGTARCASNVQRHSTRWTFAFKEAIMLRRQYEVRSLIPDGDDVRLFLQSVESSDTRDNATLLIRQIDAPSFRVGDLLYLEIIPAMLAEDDTDPFDPTTRLFE
jgi:hypothetical protein